MARALKRPWLGVLLVFGSATASTPVVVPLRATHVVCIDFPEKRVVVRP